MDFRVELSIFPPFFIVFWLMIFLQSQIYPAIQSIFLKAFIQKRTNYSKSSNKNRQFQRSSMFQFAWSYQTIRIQVEAFQKRSTQITIFLSETLPEEDPTAAEISFCCLIDQNAEKTYISPKLQLLEMQTTHATSKIIKRNSHILQIKDSLKQMSLLKRHSVYSELHSQRTNSQRQHQHSSNNDKDFTTFSPHSDFYLNITKNFIYQNSFFEKYELLQKIGSGCNACIYKCQKKTNQRIYAVKKMKIEKQQVLELKQNFISLKNLKNNLICTYKEIFFDNHQRFCFLVMEYFPFPDLSQASIKSQEEIKLIVKNLVAVLNYLHSHNICHRDIKPQNILYSQKERKIKLVDFGISKKTFYRGSRRDMLTIIGTNFYFAPQIYLGGGYDERVDLWALGITIYKLITGYTPFESEYHADTIANILKGEISFNDQIWKNYSPFAKDFVGRLLKQKNQRMTLNQCEKHLWFQVEKQSTKKFRRMSSDIMLISEDFRQQMKNYHEAIPKEQGSVSKKQLPTRTSLANSHQTSGDQDSSDGSEKQSLLSFLNINQKSN